MTKEEQIKMIEARGDKLTWPEFVWCIKNNIHAENVDDIFISVLSNLEAV